MFASLKNKIKEETGSDVTSLPTRAVQPGGGMTAAHRYQRSRPESFSSMVSMDELSLLEQREAELNATRAQLQELSGQFNDLQNQARVIEEDKMRLEEANKLLEESLKVAQVQKDLLCEEQDKIQNLQQREISKLKSMLMFREQEAVDRISQQKAAEQQVENMKQELHRLKGIEPMVEDLQDDLEKVRHSSTIEINNLRSKLAAGEEENRHLRCRIQVLEESRALLTSGNTDEKVQSLLQERKLLEQRLEEAHLHLSDIKGSWSNQNLTLETQVNRLSRQVAEETTEKRKILKLKDDLIEKGKHLEFELEKFRNEVTQRDNKIKLMGEEIDELNSALRDAREQREEEVTFLNTKLEQLQVELNSIKTNLTETEQRLLDSLEVSDRSVNAHKKQILQLEESIRELNGQLAMEQQEKITILMKNAELSQQEEILRQELRQERDETQEIHERALLLQRDLDKRLNTVNELRKQIDELISTNLEQNAKLASLDRLHVELADKNKIVKILNQRLVDMKKTLQEEIRNSNNNNNTNSSSSTNGGNRTTNHSDRILERSNSREKQEPSSWKPQNGTIAYSSSNNNCSGGNFYTVKNGNAATSGKTVVMDEVNFRYLKHVIIKFLTSREVEARHLIKAVSTLLQLSSDEEKLLQDTLTWKMSWFGSRPGQQSQISLSTIPPS
ncbi:golgin subfamily A member 1 [Toxorhynchites rutilus septentrionalis]|uniref:golgin subfamily A member 1 n=1 Tax=Toxorhynchites rutilus septentrionalis TaxID=329112 RepID=UPI0024796223|nr:golgin subfamily A member 1 [Toxorhynchites rutilus septentrionalis]